jgi:hypothetical protein
MRPRVILFVFAGRQPNMELQLPLVRRILDEHPNVDYHVWNFARNDSDREYLKTIHGDRITVFNGTGEGLRTTVGGLVLSPDGFASPAPTGVGVQFGAGEHNAAYNYYSQPEFRDHLFVKLDDDIVFLETGRFGKFVDAINTHRGRTVVANIINNGACTPVEPGIWEGFLKLGMPLLDIHVGGEFPEMAHNYFFDHYTEILGQPIKLIPSEDWLSINMVGYDWPTLGHVLATIGQPHPSHLAGRPMDGWGEVFGDEGTFQLRPRIIMKGFTAAHLAYGPQIQSEAQLTRWRDNYRRIGTHYLDSEMSRTREGEDHLPDLSGVSCGYVGVRLQGTDDWLSSQA